MNTLLGLLGEALIEAEAELDALTKTKTSIDNEWLNAVDKIDNIKDLISKL